MPYQTSAFFFFSSRRRHTRCSRDWSSDVCSSDLKVHGQSRLLRHGIHIARPLKPNGRSIQHVLMPSVCLHCQDPECLTGCPTGAIARFAEGQIDIDPKTCIGCSDCANQCPYNTISMVPRKAL